jgi:hypothetical protein
MRRLIVATAILSLAFAARANDVSDSSLKTKALAAAAVVTPAPRTIEAPFTSSSLHDPLPQLLLAEEQERRNVRGGTCEAAASDLCFDAVDGRVTYRGARKFMPQFDGLKPESMSVRNNRINFKYSFK